jgi:ubiquinone/menaquinone biosynthesis C-methylase UbiE
MAKPKGYVDTEYLAIVGEFVKHLKQRTYSLMQIQPGQRIMDVGCGPASDTIQIASLVGPKGEVIGVDSDQDMIAKAEKTARQADLSTVVKHICADATALPFESDFFDSCRSERVFQHLINPERALSEIIRVTKPEGLIVTLDTDWGTFSIDTRDVDIERSLARVHAERGLHNGYAGRQLYRLLRQHGLADINVELHPLMATDYAFVRQTSLLDETEEIAISEGLVTQDDLKHWRENLELASANGTFFASIIQVLAVGRKSSR